MKIDEKEVYISMVKLKNKKRGGDFYVTIASSKKEEIRGLDFSHCENGQDVLAVVSTIDPDARVHGGTIFAKGTIIKGGIILGEEDFAKQKDMKNILEMFDEIRKKVDEASNEIVGMMKRK